MRRHLINAIVLAAAIVPVASGQQKPPAPPAPHTGPAQAATARVTVDVLKGAWVRPDGGYTIAIKNVGSNGQLEAVYYNPRPLPFAAALAAQDGNTVRVFLELRAEGYGGSTYELSYDPSDDRLKGVYHQAVAKQRFDVYFERRAPR
jgi:hypothetical protein